MINSLTAEQEKLMHEVRNEWADRIFKCETKIDKEKVIEGVKWLYKSSSLKEPEILFVSSPLGAQYACNMLKKAENVGENVWANVCGNVWTNVGENVRANVEENVWENAGLNVWTNVRANVWANVWTNVRGNVWTNVRGNVREDVERNIGKNVRENIRSRVWASADLNVWANVWTNVRANVRANVWTNVGENVWTNVGENVKSNARAGQPAFFDFAVYGNVGDYGWLAFYDFFERIGLEYNNRGWSNFKDLMKAGVYDMIQLEGLCVVCELPNKINRVVDEDTNIGRLHSTKEPAIAWADGYDQHYLWGVYFEKNLWEKVVNHKLSAKEILGLENMEQRMVALKVYDQEKLFEELETATLEDTLYRDTLLKDGSIKTQKYELYKVEDVFSQTEYFVNYKCPSTGRFYSSCVDTNEMKGLGLPLTAEGAMAWKQGRTLEDYRNLSIEA